MSKTIIEQFIELKYNNTPVPMGERVSISADTVILSEIKVEEIMKTVEIKAFACPTVVVADSMPFKHIDHRAVEKWTAEKGGIYLPSGRTGNMSLVAAEDGLAFPGAVIAGDSENILELGVLGALAVVLNDDELKTCLETGKITYVLPQVKKMDLNGKPGEWINGSDIALHMLYYHTMPSKETMLEFTGEGFEHLSLEERYSLARMLVDMGYKSLLFETDQKVMAFLQDRTLEEGQFFFNESKENTLQVDLEKVDSMVVIKEDGSYNIKSLIDLDEENVDVIVAGGDSAGRFEDFKVPLTLVRYAEMNSQVTCYCLPGSQLVLSDLFDMGLAGLLTEMGAEVLPASMLDVFSRELSTEYKIMATSLKMAEKGAVIAGAIPCFCAAMSGKIIHPREYEMLVKQAHKEHENEHEE